MGIRLALAEHIIKMETYEVKDIKNIIIMKENLSGTMKVENYIWKKTIKIIYSKNGEVIKKSKYKNGELKKGMLERIIKKLK